MSVRSAEELDQSFGVMERHGAAHQDITIVKPITAQIELDSARVEPDLWPSQLPLNRGSQRTSQRKRRTPDDSRQTPRKPPNPHPAA